MLLATVNNYVPKEWYHKSQLQDKDGYTVAMILAYNNTDIPKLWHHKPNL